MAPERRLAERNAYCRCCDEVIEKGEPMVSFWSPRNRGQSIHICTACADDIGQLVRTPTDGL